MKEIIIAVCNYFKGKDIDCYQSNGFYLTPLIHQYISICLDGSENLSLYAYTKDVFLASFEEFIQDQQWEEEDKWGCTSEEFQEFLDTLDFEGVLQLDSNELYTLLESCVNEAGLIHEVMRLMMNDISEV